MAAMTDTEVLAWVRELCLSGRAQAIREDANVARSEVAREIDVAEPTIYRWEHGTRTPKGEAALRYARTMRRLDRIVKRAAVPA